MSLDSLRTILADRYRIERELGEGGMARVYLAEDRKHGRKVAIKVLRPELAAVIGAERFVREIQTIAALQHPHILGLIDSGEVAGTAYYVMPFVEGESLRDRLAREKQLPVAEAVRLTTEVASALDYAHRHGVIHRDIKPENILLHDGSALVADFGIALAVSTAGGSTRMTETGMSLGTPHYMSPEQAMGEREIGAASDVYALGCVTYELLTGDPPFTGSTAQAIVARVVTEAPRSLTSQRRTIPANVEAAVLTALQKLPADRFESARAYADALHDPHYGEARAEGAAAWRRPDRRVIAGLVLALAAALAFGVVQWRAAHRERPTRVVRFPLPMTSAMLVSNAALGTNMAVSPDGGTVAYADVGPEGVSRLSVRPVDQVLSSVLDGTEGAQMPCFSPDGRWLAYLIGTTVWKVPVAGGAPVTVSHTTGAPVGLTWSGSGLIVIGTADGLLAVPATGGPGRIIATIDTAAGDLYFVQPHALADGNTVLFAIQPVEGLPKTTLGILSLKTGKYRRVDLGILDPLGIIDGTLVYVTPGGVLTGVKLDLSGAKASSNPVALGADVLTTLAGASEAVLSPNGTLVYQSSNAAGVLGWVDLQGRFEPVINDAKVYTFPRLSPDGSRIALSIVAGGRSDVWIYDIASATPMRLTNAGTLNDRAEWTPDGRQVLYRADKGARTGIWWQPADLSGAPAPILTDTRHNYFEGVMSPDGRTLAYQVDDGGAHQADVMYRALSGDTTSHPIAASNFVEAQPRISPDGRWIAYATDASGTSEIMVQSYPGPGPRVQVSVGGGSEPVWSRDGHRLFYRDGRHLMAVVLATSPRLAVTSRTALFRDDYMFAQAPHPNYDVSPDGTRFLMIRNARQPELLVAYDWASELRERMRSVDGR